MRKQIPKRYKCIGGPWNGHSIALTTDSTMFFKFGEDNGRYVVSTFGRCEWRLQ